MDSHLFVVVAVVTMLRGDATVVGAFGTRNPRSFHHRLISIAPDVVEVPSVTVGEGADVLRRTPEGATPPEDVHRPRGVRSPWVLVHQMDEALGGHAGVGHGVLGCQSTAADSVAER